MVINLKSFSIIRLTCAINGYIEPTPCNCQVARLIFNNETSGTLRSFARKNGMRSLRDDALRKAEAGISTLEEVIFVTLRDDS